MGISIQEPGVKVIQELARTTPTTVPRVLTALLVGPAFQIVEALSDAGVPLPEAKAGTYRDGRGVVAYDLPGLADQASLVGFTDEIRVFLTLGTQVRELRPPSGETVILTGSSGVLTVSTTRFTDSGALFVQRGVVPGDTVRITYRGQQTDLEVLTVDSDTQLTLVSVDPIAADLSGLAYSLVRAAAEFSYPGLTQALALYGDATNYLTFRTLADSEYAGSAGDSLTLTLDDSAHYLDLEDGACGDGIFSSASATFGSSVGTVGTYPTDRYLFVSLGAGVVARKINSVVSVTYLTVEVGQGNGLTGLTYRVTQSKATGVNGVVSGTTTFTSSGALFNTTIPNTAGTPNTATYLYLQGDGVYAVSSVDSDTQLTLGAAATNATGLTYRVLEQKATATDGATGALTDFASASGGFSALSLTSKSLNHNESEAKAIASAPTDKRLTLSSGFASSFSDLAVPSSIVDTAASLALSYDANAKTVAIRLKRASGLTSNTFTEIVNAIMVSSNPSYNVAVSGLIEVVLTGAGGTTISGSAVADGVSLPFDGGSEDQQVLVDADLIGSTTPVGGIYISYRALRVDLSARAAEPTLWEVSSQSEIEEILGPIRVDNPLALAAYQALLNAPNSTVYALGVHEVTNTKPEGTVDAYEAAFEMVGSRPVYSIVPLTQDREVLAVLKAHVLAFSDNGAPRIGLFSLPFPEFEEAQVIASGTTGNTGSGFTSDTTAEFSASVDFAEAGVEAGDILVVTATASSSDSPDAVNGTVGPLYGIEILQVKTGDDFVLIVDGTATGISTDWNSLVDVDFAVYRPGASLSQGGDQAEALAQAAESVKTRRIYAMWPDEFVASVDGTDQVLKGYHLAAAWAGVVQVSPPERSPTRLSVAGAKTLRHSNLYFTKAQLDRMAGGGIFITVQDSPSALPRCRHALSTDTSDVLTREMSITKNLDSLAFDLEAAVQNQVGENITEESLTALSVRVSGRLESYKKDGRIRSGSIVSIEESDTEADKVEIVVAVLLPKAANQIEIRVQAS